MRSGEAPRGISRETVVLLFARYLALITRLTEEMYREIVGCVLKDLLPFHVKHRPCEWRRSATPPPLDPEYRWA
jgi:hypothetical protein